MHPHYQQRTDRRWHDHALGSTLPPSQLIAARPNSIFGHCFLKTPNHSRVPLNTPGNPMDLLDWWGNHSLDTSVPQALSSSTSVLIFIIESPETSAPLSIPKMFSFSRRSSVRTKPVVCCPLCDWAVSWNGPSNYFKYCTKLYGPSCTPTKN